MTVINPKIFEKDHNKAEEETFFGILYDSLSGLTKITVKSDKNLEFLKSIIDQVREIMTTIHPDVSTAEYIGYVKGGFYADLSKIDRLVSDNKFFVEIYRILLDAQSKFESFPERSLDDMYLKTLVLLKLNNAVNRASAMAVKTFHKREIMEVKNKLKSLSGDVYEIIDSLYGILEREE